MNRSNTGENYTGIVGQTLFELRGKGSLSSKGQANSVFWFVEASAAEVDMVPTGVERWENITMYVDNDNQAPAITAVFFLEMDDGSELTIDVSIAHPINLTLC